VETSPTPEETIQPRPVTEERTPARPPVDAPVVRSKSGAEPAQPSKTIARSTAGLLFLPQASTDWKCEFCLHRNQIPESSRAIMATRGETNTAPAIVLRCSQCGLGEQLV
jgi:hypothetical protein